jgi:hypothetical protein
MLKYELMGLDRNLLRFAHHVLAILLIVPSPLALILNGLFKTGWLAVWVGTQRLPLLVPRY